MFTPGPVFCQLPHLKWPTACKLVRVFEENVTDQDKKKCIQKAEIACGDQWITLITIKEFGLGCPSTLNNRVTIPIHLMQSCVHPDVSQNGVSLDASLGNQEGRNWVGYRDKRFNFRPIKNLMQGTNVVMSSQKYFHFGKVFFTGTDASVPLKQKTTESDINIFVAFLQPIEDFKYHLLQEVDDWGYVYRVPWPRLIFLKDFTKLMERAEESVLRLEKHPSGMLEVRCESKNLSFCHNEVLSSHASPLPPRTDPGSASGRSPTSQFSTEVNSHGITNGLTSKHHSQMNDSPRPSPLTRSKMSSDPEFNKDNKLKFLQGTNKSTYADILTKHSTKSCIGVNGLPKESTSNSGRHVSDSENNKSVMANNEDVSIFRPCRKSNSNKDGGMQFKLFEENRKAKAKSSETKRSEASYFKADCFAMDKKHTLKYVEGMSLQDAVIASMSSANSIGEIDMFCTIGDESIIYAAVTFDTPLQYPFFVQHNKEYCFDRCRNDTFVLIPMNLLMKSVQGTDSLYLIRNTDNVSIPSQCMKENGTKSRNYQTEASTNGIFVKDAIQGDKKSTHDLHGIEGSDNSCYVDSVIFSFFAFSTLFDHCLESPNKKNPEQAEHNISICKILKYNVVSILRATGGLRSNAIQELRHALSIYNPSFVGDWMDPEDFILTLFGEVCETPKFHRFNNGAEDFVFQIHLAYDKKFCNSDVRQLLQQSLKEIDIKLCAVPSPAFIIKLPVSNGNSIYKKIFPNLTISLNQILDSPTKISGSQILYLKAVICLKSNHYTSFVRTSPNKYSDWVYLDSKPGTGDPEVHHIHDLSKFLENLRSGNKWFDFLVRNAFICVYEHYKQPTLQETEM